MTYWVVLAASWVVATFCKELSQTAYFCEQHRNRVRISDLISIILMLFVWALACAGTIKDIRIGYQAIVTIPEHLTTKSIFGFLHPENITEVWRLIFEYGSPYRIMILVLMPVVLSVGYFIFGLRYSYDLKSKNTALMQRYMSKAVEEKGPGLFDAAETRESGNVPEERGTEDASHVTRR